MKNRQYCDLCGEEKEDAPAVHDVVRCEKTELLKGRIQIKQLKQSLLDWKGAWFQVRDLLGELWWYHPAIDNEERRAYYQACQQQTQSPEAQTYYQEIKAIEAKYHVED
jgi:hypothetical protein